MRAGRTVGSVVLLAGLAACGGGDVDPPRDATRKAFCDAIQSGATASQGQRDEAAALKAYADRLAETGTPPDIPAEARAGFEQTIDEAAKADDDGLGRGDELDSEADQAREMTDHELTGVEEMLAINNYVLRTCRTSMGE